MFVYFITFIERDTQSIIKISTHVDRKTVPSIHVRNDNRHQYTVHDYYSRELHIRALVCHIRLPSNPLHSDKCRHHNDRERNTALDKRLLDLITQKNVNNVRKIYVTPLRTYPHTRYTHDQRPLLYNKKTFIHSQKKREKWSIMPWYSTIFKPILYIFHFDMWASAHFLSFKIKKSQEKSVQT